MKKQKHLRYFVLRKIYSINLLYLITYKIYVGITNIIKTSVLLRFTKIVKMRVMYDLLCTIIREREIYNKCNNIHGI